MTKEEKLVLLKKIIFDTKGKYGNFYKLVDDSDNVFLVYNLDTLDELGKTIKQELMKQQNKDIDENWNNEEFVTYLIQDYYLKENEYETCCDICCDCNKLIPREEYLPKPISKIWINDENKVFCEKCVKNNHLTEYVNTLINTTQEANEILNEKELNGLGFYKYDDTKHLLMNFKDDDPIIMYKQIKEILPDSKIIFSIIRNNNPSATEWEVYIKKEND